MNRTLTELKISDLNNTFHKFKNDPLARIYNLTMTYSQQGLRDVKSMDGNGVYRAPRNFLIRASRRSKAHIFGYIAREKAGAVSWRTTELVRPHHHIAALFVWNNEADVVRWTLRGPNTREVNHSLEGCWKYGSSEKGLMVQLWDWEKDLLLYNYAKNRLDYHDHEHDVEEHPFYIAPTRFCPNAKNPQRPCRACGSIHSHNPT